MTLTWYIATTQPNRESVAVRFLGICKLSRDRVRPLFPRLGSRRITRGVSTEYVQPLFPSYLFIQFDDDFLWQALPREVPGISGVMMNDEEPGVIADALVTAISNQMDEDGVIRSYAPEFTCRFKRDQPVRVMMGEFCDLTGLFLAQAGERVTILLSLFNRVMEVKLREDMVEAA